QGREVQPARERLRLAYPAVRMGDPVTASLGRPVAHLLHGRGVQAGVAEAARAGVEGRDGEDVHYLVARVPEPVGEADRVLDADLEVHEDIGVQVCEQPRRPGAPVGALWKGTQLQTQALEDVRAAGLVEEAVDGESVRIPEELSVRLREGGPLLRGDG